jgi:serine/threonine protein phosphatase PrpC
MNTLRLDTATLSQPGGRAINEDACGHGNGCWVVADGLGGHGGGEVASRLAVEALLAAAAAGPLTDPAALTAALGAAETAIHARQAQDLRLSRMRTTVAILASDGRTALWAHVGDTRLYHFRAGRLCAQTADHSVPQALVNAGEITPAEVRFHEDRNRLLRTLGNDRPLRPTLAAAPLTLVPGDAFLLCTDGFWDYVTEAEMEVALASATSADDWLRTMTAGLVERATPEHDNYSAIAVWVAAAGPAP